eukprot:Gregarina_sp_Pseudo_9__1424@NODE_1953_length_1235_cov_42_066054_g1810_i0_p1_GENE_NODE_1953_length_1235_cov_42_066054_g1810_i0NODE_1953_length_1235_cov_42_066054_g1810_i0_p1_ORF_typecomplete_len220_score21_78PTPS/PF01242_19/7_9e22_NODE_1953_length_1235_cov_42_066054_g1810_i05541213
MAPGSLVTGAPSASRSSDLRKVFIGGPDLHFECAHFVIQKSLIVNENSPRKVVKEPLHGHSYRVEIVLWGEVMEDGFVIDFRPVRRETKRLCREWTHHVILPLLSPCLRIQLKAKERQNKSADDNVKLSYWLETTEGDEYMFPQVDCLPLSIKHSSAEELAEAFWAELKRRLSEVLADRKVIAMGVTVFETSGSSATFEAPLHQRSVKRTCSKSIREEV